MQVKVNIRCASLPDKGFEIDCDLEWSIYRVKMEIENAFEQHPRPEDQRLVYSGKLLENNYSLHEVLRGLDDPEITAHTMHLVCRNSHHSQYLQSHHPQSDSQAVSGGVRHRHVEHNLAPKADISQEQEQRPPEQQQQHLYAQAWAAALSHHQQSQIEQSEVPYRSHRSHDQAFWMQQYAQYMGQYMHYLHQHQLASTSSTPGSASPTPLFQSHTLFHNANATTATNRQVNPQNNNANAAVVMNNNNQVNNPVDDLPGNAAGLGAMEDDGDDDMMRPPRDAIDGFYNLTRVLVLFSIVYYYSTLARFITVTFLGLVAYLWNIGFFRRHNGRARRTRTRDAPDNNNNNNNDDVQPDNALDEVRQPADDSTNESNEDNNNDDGSDEPQGEGEANAANDRDVGTIPDQSSPFRTTVTFVTTFFTSLLPEEPPAI